VLAPIRVIDSRDPVTVVIHATSPQGVTAAVTDDASFAVEPFGLATASQPGNVQAPPNAISCDQQAAHSL
jgi:hypothetical protein